MTDANCEGVCLSSLKNVKYCINLVASSFIFGSHIALTVEAALEMFFPSSVGNYIAFLATLLM